MQHSENGDLGYYMKGSKPPYLGKLQYQVRVFHHKAPPDNHPNWIELIFQNQEEDERQVGNEKVKVVPKKKHSYNFMVSKF